MGQTTIVQWATEEPHCGVIRKKKTQRSFTVTERVFQWNLTTMEKRSRDDKIGGGGGPPPHYRPPPATGSAGGRPGPPPPQSRAPPPALPRPRFEPVDREKVSNFLSRSQLLFCIGWFLFLFFFFIFLDDFLLLFWRRLALCCFASSLR